MNFRYEKIFLTHIRHRTKFYETHPNFRAAGVKPVSYLSVKNFFTTVFTSGTGGRYVLPFKADGPLRTRRPCALLSSPRNHSVEQIFSNILAEQINISNDALIQGLLTL